MCVIVWELFLMIGKCSQKQIKNAAKRSVVRMLAVTRYLARLYELRISTLLCTPLESYLKCRRYA